MSSRTEKVECVYIWRRPHSPRETKRCFVFWVTQLVLCLQNNPAEAEHTFKHPWKQASSKTGSQNPGLRSKSTHSPKILGTNIFGTNNSKTHHHIMPLNLYLFARQLFAFQFQTGKCLMSSDENVLMVDRDLVEWKDFSFAHCCTQHQFSDMHWHAHF